MDLHHKGVIVSIAFISHDEKLMPPMPRQEYNTDLTCKQWNEMKKIIPPPKRITKRSIDRREIINAVLYLVHTGCQWRNLPHDFPGCVKKEWESVQ